MNTAEMRGLKSDELYEELLRLRKEQFGLRMQDASGQLGQYHLLKQVKKDIARVKTIMAEKQKELSVGVRTET